METELYEMQRSPSRGKLSYNGWSLKCSYKWLQGFFASPGVMTPTVIQNVCIHTLFLGCVNIFLLLTYGCSVELDQELEQQSE